MNGDHIWLPNTAITICSLYNLHIIQYALNLNIQFTYKCMVGGDKIDTIIPTLLHLHVSQRLQYSQMLTKLYYKITP